MSQDCIYWRRGYATLRLLVVFDSTYGNTELIAKSIGCALDGEIKLVRATELDPTDIEKADVLIIGSPTHGGRPTPEIQRAIDGISDQLIKGMNVVAFDTRFSSRMVRVFGYAADRIASSIEARGGKLVSPPEAFFVVGKKGPLREGELERAANWAKEIQLAVIAKQ